MVINFGRTCFLEGSKQRRFCGNIENESYQFFFRRFWLPVAFDTFALPGFHSAALFNEVVRQFLAVIILRIHDAISFLATH